VLGLPRDGLVGLGVQVSRLEPFLGQLLRGAVVNAVEISFWRVQCSAQRVAGVQRYMPAG
jgi:hypothetical protein